MDENQSLIDDIDHNKLIEVPVDVADTGDVVDDLEEDVLADLEDVLPEVSDKVDVADTGKDDVVDVPVDVVDEVDVEKKIEGKSHVI